jgi:DNA-binding response OmpR family regulator
MGQIMDKDAELASLRRKVRELEEEIQEWGRLARSRQAPELLNTRFFSLAEANMPGGTMCQYNFMKFLLKYAGSVVPNDAIRLHMWPDNLGALKSLDVLVCGFRKFLKKSGITSGLHRVYGIGVMMPKETAEALNKLL